MVPDELRAARIILPSPSNDRRVIRTSAASAPQDLLQGLMYFYLAVVAYESTLPESIHEKIDPRPGTADHFRQNLVTQRGEPSN